jgi:hypothetical protein
VPASPSRNSKTRRNATFPAFIEAVPTRHNDLSGHSNRDKASQKRAEASCEARNRASPPTPRLLNRHRCRTTLPNRPRFRPSLPFGRLTQCTAPTPSCRRPTNLHVFCRSNAADQGTGQHGAGSDRFCRYVRRTSTWFGTLPASEGSRRRYIHKSSSSRRGNTCHVESGARRESTVVSALRPSNPPICLPLHIPVLLRAMKLNGDHPFGEVSEASAV